MQICENGHKITQYLKSEPQLAKEFCNLCGAKTISKCPKCDADIKGLELDTTVIFDKSIPEYCDSCGEPFTWKGKNNKGSPETKVEVNKIIDKVFLKFHEVVKQLQKRHDNRETLVVKDEYDVQDLLHALLKIDFDDIRPEEYTPSYASGTSRMDFMLPDHEIVIETKMTRKSLTTKNLGTELIVDKEHYRKHPECKTLYCLVYDPDGYVENRQGFVNDISEYWSIGMLHVT